MALKEHQIKEAKLLYDSLDEIQNFIDENIIKPKKAMVKKDIYAGVKGMIPAMDVDKFGRAFSVCIKLGKIKGIVSAKKAGYKPLSGISVQDEDKTKIIKNKLEPLKTFLEDNMIEQDKAYTSKTLYEECGLFNDVTQAQFSQAFSIALKEGLITGIEAIRGFGYRKVGSNIVPPAPSKRAALSEDRFSIKLTRSLRLCSVDSRNWALQKQNSVGDGFVWVSKLYWPSLEFALKGIANRLVNNQLRTKNIELSDIKDVCAFIKEAEENVIKAIKGEIDDLDLADDEDEAVA